MTVCITDLPSSLARLASMRVDSSTELSSSKRSVALRMTFSLTFLVNLLPILSIGCPGVPPCIEYQLQAQPPCINRSCGSEIAIVEQAVSEFIAQVVAERVAEERFEFEHEILAKDVLSLWQCHEGAQTVFGFYPFGIERRRLGSSLFQ